MESCGNRLFDFSCGDSSGSEYFKSSFARSMTFDYIKQSKSLDYAYLDKGVIREESDELDMYPSGPHSLTTTVADRHFTSQEAEDNMKPKAIRPLAKILYQNKAPINEANKIWKIKQEETGRIEERAVQGASSDCGSLLWKNTRDQQSATRCSLRYMIKATLETENSDMKKSPAVLSSTVLQSQVDSLSWQLKQTEQSRQMYKELMEQVVKFLERAHRSLDIMQSKMNAELGKQRVPRSRSVHTVDMSPVRNSPCTDFHRASSIAQIESPQSYSNFRDFTWRRPRRVKCDPDEIPPDKLSQEAFRLLRTAQSLLNMPEPVLAKCAEASVTEPSEILPSTFGRKLSLQETPSSPSVGSCSSLVHGSCSRNRKSFDASSIYSITSKMTDIGEFDNSALTSGLESAFAGRSMLSSPSPSPNQCKGRISNQSNSTLEGEYELLNPMKPHQLSEDESGFSSMSSFQEVGLPLSVPHKSEGSFQEVGLPIVDEAMPKHRRWSSSPVETNFAHNNSFSTPSEGLRVLWV